MKNPRLFLELGKDFQYKDRCTLGKHCYGWDGSPRLNFYRTTSKLVIGNFVSFAPGTTIHVGGEHFTEYVSTYPFSSIFDDVPQIECVKSKGDVVIGSDVWVANDATILSGVMIGHGAVIGAGAIVTKNVLPYMIVAGNPAREIRRRFTDGEVEQLLRIQWWNWPDEKIDKCIPLLMQADIGKFIKRADEMEAEDAIQ